MDEAMLKANGSEQRMAWVDYYKESNYEELTLKKYAIEMVGNLVHKFGLNGFTDEAIAGTSMPMVMMYSLQHYVPDDQVEIIRGATNLMAAVLGYAISNLEDLAKDAQEAIDKGYLKRADEIAATEEEALMKAAARVIADELAGEWRGANESREGADSTQAGQAGG